MDYGDKKILEFKKKAKEAKELEDMDITKKPVRIKDRYYQFKETSFLEDRVRMYIPEDFEDMKKEIMDMKYPSIHRPKVIKTDETNSVNITLNPIDSDLTEELVGRLKDSMKVMIKKTNPASVFYADGIEKVEDKNIGYFEFKSPAIDDFIYNIMFVFELDKKTVIGTFCCMYDDYIHWRNIGFEMIKTIRVVKKD
ncbi:hypothetical protein [Dethiothermospora halolimnae]|uniref:hypothetical protein n=1 Tax=Dethiothermospora halolimnae TaxID=3114390 RepID=UPI003CCBF2B9